MGKTKDRRWWRCEDAKIPEHEENKESQTSRGLARKIDPRHIEDLPGISRS